MTLSPSKSADTDWFRTLAEATATAIFVYDARRLLYVNRAAEQLAGWPAERLLQLGPEDLIHPDDLECMRERILRRRRGKALEPRIELRILTRGGEVRWLDVTAEAITLDDRFAVLGSAIDVTERKRVEEALLREKERAQVTLAAIGDGVIRTDAQGRVEYLNPVAERLTGWQDGEARSRPLEEVFRVVDADTHKPLANPVELCLTRQQPIDLPGRVLLWHRGGDEAAIRNRVAPIEGPDGHVSGAVVVFKDITRVQGLERRMSYLSRHDPLTGLLNRSAFERRLRESLVTAHHDQRRHALLLLDLEEMRLINDSLGHAAGDEVLRKVAETLGSQLRRWDTLARLGSDEFGILLENVSPAQARKRAGFLRQAVGDLRIRWNDRTFQVGVSLGMVLLDDQSGDLQEILRAVDTACHVAKDRGRNRLHEYRPDDTAIAERSGAMHWIHHLQDALDQDRLHLAYQPIQSLHEPHGPFGELLVRLEDDQGRLIPSRTFMPTAERYRLTPVLDRWVVRRVLELLAAQGDDAAPGVFAVNLSGQTLGDDGFLGLVEECLETSSVDPSRLCFEITETAAIAHLAQATRFISTLRARGCRFILDDFGSGLSSFAYLKNLSVDFLKIDNSFVREMVHSRVQRALVRSIHQIGHEMGITTIAEGVEDQATLEALAEIGVDFVQGYWVGRPEQWD